MTLRSLLACREKVRLVDPLPPSSSDSPLYVGEIGSWKTDLPRAVFISAELLPLACRSGSVACVDLLLAWERENEPHIARQWQSKALQAALSTAIAYDQPHIIKHILDENTVTVSGKINVDSNTFLSLIEDAVDRSRHHCVQQLLLSYHPTAGLWAESLDVGLRHSDPRLFLPALLEYFDQLWSQAQLDSSGGHAQQQALTALIEEYTGRWDTSIDQYQESNIYSEEVAQAVAQTIQTFYQKVTHGKDQEAAL